MPTIRTQNDLLTNVFSLNKPIGSGHIADIQDLVASVPVILGYDDSSTQGFPSVQGNILNLAIYVTARGGFVGTGSTQTQRQNNATYIQAAFDLCNSRGLTCWAPAVTFEFENSAGLLIKATYNAGFRFIGTRCGTIFSQFYTTSQGAPIMTFGDTTGVAALFRATIDGMSLRYGASMSTKTSAQAMVFGACSWCNFDNIEIGIGGVTNPSYDAVYFYANGGNNFFSNGCRNWQIWGFQRDALRIFQGGTGNVWDNIYLNNGSSGIYNAYSGYYVNINQSFTENTFIQLNCEWGAGNGVLFMQDCTGVNIKCLHIEGIKMTGTQPWLIYNVASTLTIDTFDLVDVIVQSANFTGSPLILQDFSGTGTTLVMNFNWLNNASGQLDTTITLVTLNSAVDAAPQHRFLNGKLRDGSGNNIFWGRFQFDAHMPVASFAVPLLWGEYVYGQSGSTVKGAFIQSISSAYTHYGQYEDATIVIPLSITAFTLTIANTMGASGNQVPKLNNRLRIKRATGTVSGTLTVNNGSASAISGPPNTSGAVVDYQFTGSNYVTFTPVT
jgi:hypothetical protein